MAGMIDWFSGFVGIDARIFITAFVLVALLAGIVVAWRGRRELQKTLPNALVNVIVTASFVVFAALAVLTLMFAWDYVHSTLLFFSGEDLEKYLNSKTAARLLLSIAALVVAYVVVGVVREAVDRLTRHRDAISRHQAQILHRLTQVTVYVTAGATILGIWGQHLTGILVGAGFLGIVVGMAARQTLGAVLAGFMLMFARPFEIGDWVEIEEREGIVTDISIFNTRIQTFDGEYVLIPNDIVGGNTIINRSRKGRLRLEVDVGIDYDGDIERATEIAEEAMDEPEDVLAVPSPQVVTKSLGDSAVVLGLRFWIDKPSARRKWRAKTTVINTVKAAFDEEDIKIPYPQRELSGRAETNGFRVARGRERELGATMDGGEATDGGTAADDGGNDSVDEDGDER
ncbi:MULTISPECIES: mechanosensitive ion channel family protein [unclassified Haladaptatus]|uniref:mechanosensitive ion channel family protein n=1 Tax=unclassified Haladaptatus TaxID=2622732 RepID=UPI00209C5998|nr:MULTISPECIES: mechanosensitive ion channel family protein [unclassified Haladaptatus]MCO8245964.1 mechanosensitive ion channel family protein [Haladaptatus sp. AB643]MCO8254416.1 mechanosensitive ion channel family protein [Haladaptatus sp. AB618]